MKSYKTEAIILKSKNYGEADRILTVFSKNHGKLVIIAKGARRITSKKGPTLEVFNKVTLMLSNGKNFDIVSESTVIENFAGLRKKLKLVGLAYNVCELTDKLTPEHQESPAIFDLLSQTLKSLSTKVTDKNLIINFKQKLLEDLGYVQKDIKSENIDQYIESITEREVKSRKFLMRI